MKAALAAECQVAALTPEGSSEGCRLPELSGALEKRAFAEIMPALPESANSQKKLAHALQSHIIVVEIEAQR